MNYKKIKILHIQETIGSGGVERRRLSLAKHLDKERFDQKFICSLNASDNDQLSHLLSTATVNFFEDSVVNIAGLNSSLMTINFNNPEQTKISVYYASNKNLTANKEFFST